jgi:hypothetical protein
MMKITVLTATTMALAASTVFAGHNTPAAGPAVVVCLESPLGPGYAMAPGTTVAMFARIGVNLDWRGLSHCPSGALRISLSNNTPEDLRPGALAYAMPYEGTHIVVFLDRVRVTVEAPSVPVLLAHVFAHEITHILQGCNHHSESGLMKAKWDRADYRQMAWQALPFAPVDIDLIHDGMAQRAAVAMPESHRGTERPGDR